MSANLRKAGPRDLDWVVETYRLTCDWAAKQDPNPVGWRFDRYPTPQVAREALDRGDLYLFEQDGQPLSTLVLNHDQPAEYAGADWGPDLPEDRVWVVHTFMVRPGTGGGIGRATLQAAHALARQKGLEAIRLDTSELNLRAQRLYRSLGYQLCGVVDLRLGVPGYRWFHCYQLALLAAADQTSEAF